MVYLGGKWHLTVVCNIMHTINKCNYRRQSCVVKNGNRPMTSRTMLNTMTCGWWQHNSDWTAAAGAGDDVDDEDAGDSRSAGTVHWCHQTAVHAVQPAVACPLRLSAVTRCWFYSLQQVLLSSCHLLQTPTYHRFPGRSSGRVQHLWTFTVDGWWWLMINVDRHYGLT